MEVPRESLIRKVEFRAEASDDGLSLEGYGAVFNDPAMIDSWEGQFREQILPGAFAKTLAERKPVLMFDHGQHPVIGQLPIGTITSLGEDAKGLHVKARLADNWMVEPVRDAIRGGAVTGMSIRMSVKNDDWATGSDKVAERSIKEIQLHELGPVVFPAYDNTSVSVRSRGVLEGLADPAVRSEIARILAGGGLPEPDPEEEEERRARVKKLQRNAQVALILGNDLGG